MAASRESVSRRTALAGLTAFGLATGVLGCHRTSPAPLRLGLTPWPPNDLYALASERGYTTEATHIVDFVGSSQALRAFRNQAIEVMPCTLDEAIRLALDIANVRIVQVLDTSAGADAILARPDILTLADLQHKRVGYEDTALGAFVLSRALELGGLTPSDITPVTINIGIQAEALRRAQVDAVVTYEPVLSKLRGEGFRTLFDSRAIPGEIVDVLVVRAPLIEERRADVAAIVRGWFEAARLLAEQPNEAAALLAPRLHLPTAEVPGAFADIILYDEQENLRLLAGTTPALIAAIDRMSSSLLGLRLIRAAPSAREMLDASVLAAAMTPR